MHRGPSAGESVRPRELSVPSDGGVEGLYPTPHIYEQMTAQIMATDNMNLEHNTMINIDTVAHMILHYTQS